MTFNTVNEDTVTTLRGNDDWYYGEAECRSCGASHPLVLDRKDAPVVRTLVTAKGVYFETVRECLALVQRGQKMVRCGSKLWKIEILEETELADILGEGDESA